MAMETAKVLNGDLFEIRSVTPYTTADLDYNDEMCRVKIEQNSPNLRPAIAEEIPSLKDYQTVVIAYPIWFGQEPRIIDSFAEKADLAEKTVVPICTSGGSDIGRSGEFLRQISAPTAKWKDGRRFANTDSNELAAYFKEIGILP